VADEAKAEVTVAAAGCSVTIIGDEPAGELTKLALKTLAEVRGGGDGRLGPASAGFTTEIDTQFDHDRQSGSFHRPVRAGGYTSTQVVTPSDFGFGAGATP
jgi:hypothetical protein